jgi:hypothetical protein
MSSDVYSRRVPCRVLRGHRVTYCVTHSPQVKKSDIRFRMILSSGCLIWVLERSVSPFEVNKYWSIRLCNPLDRLFFLVQYPRRLLKCYILHMIPFDAGKEYRTDQLFSSQKTYELILWEKSWIHLSL